MRVLTVVAVTVSLACVTLAHADCAKDAGELRAHLRAEQHRADVWNASWAIIFTAAAAAQLAFIGARFNPTGDYDAAFQEAQYVGTIKASLGTLSKVVLPLKIPQPAPPNADACTDAAQLRKVLAKAAKKERGSMWLTIIGGTVVNLTGAIWLWARQDLATAALSFASGLPAGPASAITQPKGSMRLYKQRRVEWVAGLGWFGATF